MRYEQKIAVDTHTADEINWALNVEPDEESVCMGENETVTKTVSFPNGFQMDIKCCGVRYREGESNVAWAEAVLFDDHGRELCFTEPAEDFFRSWELAYNGDIYCAKAEREPVRERIKEQGNDYEMER